MFPINPFDLTKVWPHQLAPLQDIGRLTLNRNVENYFAETEQASFAPSNLVPGICASPDKMLQAGLLAYQDAQRYRVGVNHNHLPVNAPRCPMHHYQHDGTMAGMNAPTATGYSHGNEVNFSPMINQAHRDLPPAMHRYRCWKTHGSNLITRMTRTTTNRLVICIASFPTPVKRSWLKR